MKITFINPKIPPLGSRSLGGLPLKIKQLFANNPKLQERIEFTKKAFSALGILTVAGVVPENQDYQLEFLDENMEEIDFNRPFDLAAVGGNSDQINRALQICDLLRKKNIPVVAGGTAVTTFPDIFYKRGIPVIIGEGELLFKIFLDDFKKGNTRKIYDHTIAPTHIDLKDSPIPRYDIARKYPYTMMGVQCSRGCPYNCNFCQVTGIFGNQFRYKPIDNIIKEIKQVKRYWTDGFFFFYDDNPFANRDFTLELFRRLNHREKIPLGTWGTNANVNLYKDRELMDAITEAGPVSFLGIGLESLSEESLSTINNKMKFNHVTAYREAIQTFKTNNINPIGYFMFGFEKDKPGDLQKIVDFLLENRIDSQLSRVTPMPGTRLYDRLKEEYENRHREIRKSSLGEWGTIKKYFSSKCAVNDEEMQNLLCDAYTVVFSDNHFFSQEMIPTIFLL
ncbi:MAG: radical SAM protein [Candidatus Aminicenantes bacterium]|jgi:radical SAM superfamily enzyme YgiQ (UPF0313 family)